MATQKIRIGSLVVEREVSAPAPAPEMKAKTRAVSGDQVQEAENLPPGTSARLARQGRRSSAFDSD